MAKKEENEEFSAKESKRRFEAALKGARNVGHQPMAAMTPKRPKTQSKKRSNRSSKGN